MIYKEQEQSSQHHLMDNQQSTFKSQKQKIKTFTNQSNQYGISVLTYFFKIIFIDIKLFILK
jgi:hypothetical protein